MDKLNFKDFIMINIAISAFVIIGVIFFDVYFWSLFAYLISYSTIDDHIRIKRIECEPENAKQQAGGWECQQ